MAETDVKEYSLAEVAKHNTAEDCWMIIKDDGLLNVYDVTAFLDDHPGGPEIIIDLAGQNATDEFEDIGHSNDARDQLKKLRIGKVEGAVKEEKKAVSKGGVASGSSGASSGGSNLGFLAVIAVVAAAIAFFVQNSK